MEFKLVIEKVIDYNRVRFKYCTDGETLADTPAVDPAITLSRGKAREETLRRCRQRRQSRSAIALLIDLPFVCTVWGRDAVELPLLRIPIDRVYESFECRIRASGYREGVLVMEKRGVQQILSLVAKFPHEDILPHHERQTHFFLDVDEIARLSGCLAAFTHFQIRMETQWFLESTLCEYAVFFREWPVVV